MKIKLNLKDALIKGKLRNSLIIVLLVTSITSIMGIIFLIKTNYDYKYVVENYGFSQGNIARALSEIQNTRSLVRDIIFLKDVNDLEETKILLDNSIKKVDGLLEEVKETNITDKEKEVFISMYDKLIKYKEIRGVVQQLAYNGFNEEAYTVFRRDGSPLMDKIVADVDELLQVNIDTCNNLVEKLWWLQIVAIFIIVISMIISVILVKILSEYTDKIIDIPLKRVKDIAKELSNGNLDVKI